MRAISNDSDDGTSHLDYHLRTAQHRYVFKRIKTYCFRDRISDLPAKTDTSLGCAGLQKLLEASEYKVALICSTSSPAASGF